jgi:hypothetical protein
MDYIRSRRLAIALCYYSAGYAWYSLGQIYVLWLVHPIWTDRLVELVKCFASFVKLHLHQVVTLKQLDLFRAGFIYCITFYRLHFIDDFSLIMKIIFLLAIRFYVVTFERVHIMNTKMTFEHSGKIFNVWYILADKRT